MSDSMENSGMKTIESTGDVYWITGLSGAGKTTLGRLLYSYLKNRGGGTRII